MARIAGVGMPREKRLDISLTYIFGVGRTTAQKICAEVGRHMGATRNVVIPLPNAVSFVAGYGSELLSRVRGKVPILNRDKAAELSQEAWTCSVERARQDLGYVPTMPLERGTPATLEWFRKEGWL